MAPVLSIAAGLVLGAGFAAAVGGGFSSGPLATLVMALGTLVALGTHRSSARPRAWAVLALGAAAAIAGAASIPARASSPDPRGVVRVRGEVVELRAGRDRADAIVRVQWAGAIGERSIAPEPGTRIRIRNYAASEGASVAGTIALEPVPGFVNPSPHPRWPLVDPPRADARAIALASEGGSWIGRARAHAREALGATLEEPSAGIARALVLGDLALGEDDGAIVRDAGLSHVLAVSGMHVTLLIGAIVWLLRRAILRIPAIAQRIEATRIACAIGIPLALLYAPLAGGAPSAWRAALTAAIAWGMRAGARRADPIAVTAASAIALGVIDPESVVRPAFLLSIAATAAVLAPIAEADARPIRALAIASVRATIATAPIVIWCFEGIAITGVIANVVIVPIASAVLLPLAAIHTLLASISTSLAAPTAPLFDLAARGFLAGCGALASPDWSRALPPLDLPQGLAVAIACGALLAAKTARARAIVVASAALAIGLAEVRLRIVERPRGIVRATFLDVGQGDAALIDLPDGRLMLVDAGGAVGAGIDPGAAVLVPLLRARRRDRIDVAVITHPHPDHYGGLAALLDRFPIGEIWDSGQAEDETPDGELSRLLARARASGVPVLGPRELCGAPRAFGVASIAVLAPCPAFDAGWDPNDNSLVLRMTIGVRTMLLTGDVERLAEEALVRSGALSPLDVLKVGHHGSRTSSTPAFLAAVRPGIAIVSAGRANRFGHPHEEVLARLSRFADRVVRIDRAGGTMVWTDGRVLSIE